MYTGPGINFYKLNLFSQTIDILKNKAMLLLLKHTIKSENVSWSQTFLQLYIPTSWVTLYYVGHTVRKLLT